MLGWIHIFAQYYLRFSKLGLFTHFHIPFDSRHRIHIEVVCDAPRAGIYLFNDHYCRNKYIYIAPSFNECEVCRFSLKSPKLRHNLEFILQLKLTKFMSIRSEPFLFLQHKI